VIHRQADFALGPDELVCDTGDVASGEFEIRGTDFIARRRRCGLPIEVQAHPDAGMAGILRWIVGVLLIEQGGLLLHAMSYAHAGSGVACAGPSGRGKTTLAGLLAPHVRLFSDETTALRFIGEAPTIHATPFAGEMGMVSGPASAMLDALFFLQHGSQMAARPLDAPRAAAALLGCTFAPLRGGAWMQACLATAERLVRSVPCFELEFLPQPDVWETIQDVCHRASVPAT
jgi:hypothetical protein